MGWIRPIAAPTFLKEMLWLNDTRLRKDDEIPGGPALAAANRRLRGARRVRRGHLATTEDSSTFLHGHTGTCSHRANWAAAMANV